MNKELLLGLITGLLFGYLLQKARVVRFEKQVSAMLFKDMTIFKFMLSAILVGMVGIQILSHFSIITLNHKSLNIGAVLIGGTLFGIGWAITGFCPGTSLGALGEGRWHAVFVIIGMLVGAAIYAELFPFFKSTILAWKDFGRVGLKDISGIPSWVIVMLLYPIIIAVFYLFEKKKI